MSVGSICRREVHCADAIETARAASERMLEHNVGTLVVLNDEKKPIGLVTDRDLVLRVMAAHHDPDVLKVGEAMTLVPRTVSESTPLELALGIMRSGPFRRLPVVDDSGRLVGLLSLDDVLDLLSEEFRLIGGVIAAEAPRD